MTYSRVLVPVVFALGIVFIFPLVAAAQPKIPHTLEGRSACTTCHQVGGSGVGTSGGTGLPTSHQGRTDATCSACHTAAAAPAPTATAAPAAPKPTASPSPTTPPASTQPAASPTPSAASATALPKSGGPPAALLAVLAASLVGAGWVARRYTRLR